MYVIRLEFVDLTRNCNLAFTLREFHQSCYPIRCNEFAFHYCCSRSILGFGCGSGCGEVQFGLSGSISDTCSSPTLISLSCFVFKSRLIHAPVTVIPDAFKFFSSSWLSGILTLMVFLFLYFVLS